ncbi:phosphate ABC transporter permease PtsA, partial [Klebsiella pneumoniae]
MATIELQTTAELAESRRKMQAKRRMKNRIALALFTEMTPPPNTAGGGL